MTWAARRDLSGWVRRAWASHTDRAPWLASVSPAVRTGARAQLAATLLERLDHGRRVTL